MILILSNLRPFFPETCLNLLFSIVVGTKRDCAELALGYRLFNRRVIAFLFSKITQKARQRMVGGEAPISKSQPVLVKPVRGSPLQEYT